MTDFPFTVLFNTKEGPLQTAYEIVPPDVAQRCQLASALTQMLSEFCQLCCLKEKAHRPQTLKSNR